MQAKVTLRPKGDGPRYGLYLNDNVDISQYVQQIDMHHRAGGPSQIVIRMVGQFEIDDMPAEVQALFEEWRKRDDEAHA